MQAQASNKASAYILPFLKRYRLVFQVDLAFSLLHFLMAVVPVIQVIRSPQNLLLQSVLFLIHIGIGATGTLADAKLLQRNPAAAPLAYLNACLSVLGRILGIFVTMQLAVSGADWSVLSWVNPEMMSTVSFVLAPFIFYNLLYAVSVFQFVKWSKIICEDRASIPENT